MPQVSANKERQLARVDSIPQARQTGEDRYVSRGVAKAFEALSVLARSQTSLSVNELARGWMSLAVLRSGLCKRLNPSSKWSAWTIPLSLARGQSHWRFSIRSRSLAGGPRTVASVERTLFGNLGMSVLYPNRIEVVQVIESPRLMRVTNVVGRILPPHASSMGKALTANQSEAIRHTLIRTMDCSPSLRKPSRIRPGSMPNTPASGNSATPSTTRRAFRTAPVSVSQCS